MRFAQWINEETQLALPFDKPKQKVKPVLLGTSKDSFGVVHVRVALGDKTYTYHCSYSAVLPKIIAQFKYNGWQALNRLKDLAFDYDVEDGQIR